MPDSLVEDKVPQLVWLIGKVPFRRSTEKCRKTLYICEKLCKQGLLLTKLLERTVKIYYTGSRELFSLPGSCAKTESVATLLVASSHS